MFKIGEVAHQTGLTIRTLHHFDEIRLLEPSQRDPSGYRRYSKEDLAKLQQILLYRELGIPLADIKKTLELPENKRLETLRNHRISLAMRKSEVERLIQTLEKTIHHMENQTMNTLSESELYGGLSRSAIDAINAEVDAAWDPTIVAESRRRVKNMSAGQWKAVKSEGDRLEKELAALMHQSPAHATVQALIARHHAWIEHFYPCPKSMYLGLADLYTSDERFSAHYHKTAPGLAEFLSNAMRIFAETLPE